MKVMADKILHKRVQKSEKMPSQATADRGNVFSSVKILALVLGLIAMLVYANTLSNGFVLDDDDVIVKNTITAKGTSAIPELFSTPYRAGSLQNSNDYYRPLSLATFAIERDVFGLEPAPYHLVNILLFAGCVILLFLFLLSLLGLQQSTVAFICSLLFALHPIHTEVVANVKSRDELLCFFFAFLSVNLFLRYVEQHKPAFLLFGSVCYFLSLLSKETSITFVAIIPVIFLLYRDVAGKSRIAVIAATVMPVIVFLFIRHAVLAAHNISNTGSAEFIENPLVLQGLSVESRIATAILICGYYIKFIVFPYPLVCDYSYNSISLTHFSDPFVILSLAVYVTLIVVSVARLFKNKKDPYAFGILFYLVNITLFTNLFFLLAVGERFTFFGSVGFCLILALLIVKLTKSNAAISLLKQRRLLYSLAPFCLVYALVTINRNADWKDNYTLFTADVQKQPDNCRLNYFIGYELESVIRPAEPDISKQAEEKAMAIGYFRKGIAIYPSFADAYANIGYIYFHDRQMDSAEIYDQLALKYQPVFPNVVNNLAEIYFGQKKFDKAIDLYTDAIQKSPHAIELYANLSTCLGSVGRYDSAIYYAKAGLLVDAGYKKLYENIALCYKLTNRLDSAGKYAGLAQ